MNSTHQAKIFSCTRAVGVLKRLLKVQYVFLQELVQETLLPVQQDFNIWKTLDLWTLVSCIIENPSI
jgi:hypothetical protein